MTFAARIVSQSVDVDADTVYAYARQMETLPQWASGLASGLSREAGRWYTESPMGKVRVEMAPVNKFGVLDHDVTLPDGTRVHNAFRVTPAGNGSMLSFVVLRLPGVGDEAFEADVAHVAADLAALKRVVETLGDQ